MPPNHFKVRSFAKINLFLEVLGRRPDRFHELRTIFQTVTLYDTLRLERAAPGNRLFTSNRAQLNDARDNLIVQAATLLQEQFHPPYGASISLTKRIPLGAGLGGGSSNAAATLLGLNRFWRLNLSLESLLPLARRLGADVPFFLWGGTALGIGRGDEIFPYEPVTSFHAVLIFPGVSVSTGEAYEELSRNRLAAEGPYGEPLRIAPAHVGVLNRGEFYHDLFNSFEPVVLPRYPRIARAHRFLKRHGAVATLLSGSGSTVFGIFKERQTAIRACAAVRERGWSVFLVRSLSRRRYARSIFPL